MVFHVATNCILVSTVEPQLCIQAPADPEYLSDLSLSCSVHVPQKLHRHLVPYMTVTWHTPFEESSTAGAPVVDDGASLHLNLSIASVNETHNGVYNCRLVIQLPNTSSPITRETDYTLNLKGEIMSQFVVYYHCLLTFLLFSCEHCN